MKTLSLYYAIAWFSMEVHTWTVADDFVGQIISSENLVKLVFHLEGYEEL